MKFFKSTILAMLGVAVALTSCSDDNKYEPEAKKAGAYFAQGTATQLTISAEETSFTVPVYRTEDAGTQFAVTVDELTGDFTVPTTVTFDADKTVTELVITYDPAKLEEGKPYNMSLTVGDGINVARNSVNLIVTMEMPFQTEKFEEGICGYMYDGYWSGLDYPLEITIGYKPATPNNVTWTIDNWGMGIPFQITCEDFTDVDSEGDVTVDVPIQYMGIVNADYGKVYVASYYNFLIAQLGYDPDDSRIQQFRYASYYTPETGTFNLYVIYYVPEYGQGTSYFAEGYETCQMDGYPQYGVQVTYDGLFTDRQGNMSAMATIETEEDVVSVKTVMVAGDDPEVGLAAIEANEADVQELQATGDALQAKYPVKKGGVYTIVAASVDAKGELKGASYDTFEIALNNGDDANWDDAGMADYIDGFVIPAFKTSSGPLVNTDFQYSVPLQKYAETSELNAGDALYRLVKPYGEDFVLVANNAYPANRNINFYINGEYFAMMPQESGFGAATWKGELTIGNFEGYFYEEYYDQMTLADLVPLMIKSDIITPQQQSTVEDGIITVATQLIGAPAIGSGEFGYKWNSPQTGYIILPEAAANVRKHTSAKAVAKVSANATVSISKKKATRSKLQYLHQFNGPKAKVFNKRAMK